MVLRALKDTLSPDFVVNLTVAGLATVLKAVNLTFFLDIYLSYHCLAKIGKAFRKVKGNATLIHLQP